MDYGAAIREYRLSSVWRVDDFGRLMAQLETYLPSADLPSIAEAHEFSAKAHQGQLRRSGDPYITHPVAVAEILAGLHLDAASIKAALLHDVIEDTPSTLTEIQARFGDDVALLVDGVSKIDHLRFDSVAEAQAESFRKMLLAMAKDLRVILVKLADRTHNMRTIQSLPVEKQRRIARETLDVYAPIANRLGVYSLKVELEDLGFKTFYPFRYRVLQRSLRRAKGNQRQFLRKIESRLTDALREAHVEARVLGREKHLYSIYLKMHRKQAHLSDIVDVYGVRVVVGDVDSCYRALGITHQVFKPMPGRFKDFISIPRVNGYQSLHTTLFGPNGLPLEVQIRTEEMDKVAERGVAAHWQYKAVDKGTYSTEDRAREWLAGLMEMERAANSEEFLETVKADLFPDKVYVFTPKGAIMRLPRGATAVDFAYAVHTDIGNRCVAAKIDRRLVPLKTLLRNGETVEIVTARGARPNPSWVNFVTTAKARNAIRGYLKNLKRDEAQELGRRLLNQELVPYSLSLRKLPR
ncbi:MAG TPA: RelA/SpoT family protein, partial [Vicinamibacterales bacterium]|nr:RelA/SpoT family protein [Vicinamibacterales bacterium]